MRECPSCFCCYDDTVVQCPNDECATFHSLPGSNALDGKYVLERRLGEGGMGIVYKAHHKFLKTTRAIKTIKLDLIGNDTSFVKRFHQEAMAAAAIGHPNIIAVLDYGLLGEKIPYIVMEFVEGVSLEAVILNKGRFTPEEALEYMQVITSALSAAHKHGIVHRDLKPLNIMIESGGSVREQIRILDFGLAKIKSSDLFGSFVAAKTVGIVGSPAYMAPEQWSGEETDRRCDVYSLGIILHEMLTGDVPFKGSNIPSIMKKHLMAPPPALATPGSGISQEVEKVVHHALEKQLELRTASVEDFVAELEQAVLHPAPAKPKAKRRSTSKATTVARRRKTAQISGDESDASVNPEVEVSAAAAAAPVFAQDVSTLRTPDQHVPSESDTAKLPLPSTPPAPPLPKQAQSLSKTTEPLPRKVEERAPVTATEKADASDRRSTLPIRPPIEQRLPGRVAIGQQSLVGNFFKKRFAVPVVAGVLVLGLIVLAAFVYSRKGAEPPALQAQGGTLATNTKREMVLIEGGTFTMGWNQGKGQKGEHTVTVPSFYLDKYEVTNAEYAEFIKDTGRQAPVNPPTVKEKNYWVPWTGNDPPPGREHWPVANVSPKDVEAFAAWLSQRDGVVYRLPTEEEWEFAARNGAKDSLFPWGNSWEARRANINQERSPVNVGSFPQGATQNGVQDMVGNVWEWTSSKSHFYDNRLVEPYLKNARVVRGGSFVEKMNSEFYNATDRYWFGDENFKYPTIGFRLARDRQ